MANARPNPDDAENTGENPALGAGQPSATIAALQQRFAQRMIAWHSQHGDDTVVICNQAVLEVFTFLKNDPATAFEMMIDLTAVDLLPKTPRFEVVVHLFSLTHNHRLRVKVVVEETKAEVDSITELWVAADWYERECHEMYGIRFKGHPNLAPLLLYQGFEGYPLRKDYDKGLAQPLVELRPIPERYDYGEHYQPVKNIANLPG